MPRPPQTNDRAAREGEGVINNPRGGAAGGADGDPRRPQGARGRPTDPDAPDPGSASLDRPAFTSASSALLVGV